MGSGVLTGDKRHHPSFYVEGCKEHLTYGLRFFCFFCLLKFPIPISIICLVESVGRRPPEEFFRGGCPSPVGNAVVALSTGRRNPQGPPSLVDSLTPRCDLFSSFYSASPARGPAPRFFSNAFLPIYKRISPALTDGCGFRKARNRFAQE